MGNLLFHYINPHPQLLDKIYICKMLKEEDRNIVAKRKRSSNIVEVVENDYKNTKNGIPIEIVDWETLKGKM